MRTIDIRDPAEEHEMDERDVEHALNRYESELRRLKRENAELLAALNRMTELERDRAEVRLSKIKGIQS